MEQLALTLARRADPQTSHDAAERAVVFRSSHEGKIYGALLEAGVRGLTAKEAALYMPLTDVQINRRLSSMGERKLITRNLVKWNGPQAIYEQRGGCCVWRVVHG